MILGLDVAGVPVDWLTWEEAVHLQVRGQVAWSAGRETFRFHGGINHRNGMRSVVEVSSIISIRSARAFLHEQVVPSLTNVHLFRRDRFICLYCGESHGPARLTRDHVIPTSRGGEDAWANVVTACSRCNSRKGAKTPEEAAMPLLALPYVPSRVEAMVLHNRRILADQMEFLREHLPKRSSLR
jgi:5-methylcytosine-specific restriction endonuclease McrA